MIKSMMVTMQRAAAAAACKSDVVWALSLLSVLSHRRLVDDVV